MVREQPTLPGVDVSRKVGGDVVEIDGRTVAFRIDAAMSRRVTDLEQRLQLSTSDVLRHALTLGLPMLDPSDVSIIRPKLPKPGRRGPRAKTGKRKSAPPATKTSKRKSIKRRSSR